MRLTAPLIILVLLFALFASPAWSTEGETLSIKGYVESDNRMTIEPGGDSRFSYNENILGIKLQAFPSTNVLLQGSFQLVTIALDERLDDDKTMTIDQQQDRTVTDPVRLQIDDAFISVKGLVFKNLDMKLGKQKISWGAGDQFNPSNALDPDDFHDPLKFGQRIATPALRFDYYLGPVTLTAVGQPLFYPSLLPVTDIRPIFEKQFDTLSSRFEISTGDPLLDVIFDDLMVPAIQGARLGNVSVRSRLPERTPENGNAALKVAGKLATIDMSASYSWTRDHFGVPRRAAMTVDPFATGTKIIDAVDLDIEQEFPRIQVIGADFASSIPVIDVGIWGEAAYVIPVSFKTQYFLDAGSMNRVLSSLTNKRLNEGLVIAEDEPLKDPFLKAVGGMDYTFPGAWYINVQYIRGLPTDNTAEAQANYVFGGVDKPFFHDTVKVRVFSGVCFDDKSWVLYPQIFLTPMDALEFHVGTFHVFGDVDTKFGAFGDDIAFVQGKVSF